MTQPAPADQEAPPLRTFHSLDDDLRRERRVFTTVIVLLVGATIAAAAFAIRARIYASLRNEEQVARLYDQSLADKILDRHSALTVASLILSLHTNGALQGKPVRGGRLCLPLDASHADPMLQASCNETAEILSSYGDGPPIEMIRIRDGAAYVHQPPDAKAPPPADAALAQKILQRFDDARIDLVAAAKDKRVLWSPAPAIGRQTNEMIGATIVAQGSTPYAIVLTSIDLAELYTAVRTGNREPLPLMLGEDGRLLIGAWSPAQAGRIDARLATRADGVYHWIAPYGWALRRAPPVSGFGHTLLLLPYRQLFGAMRNDLLLIFALAATLIALLLSTYRYWNYRYLGRIYSQARRALESEMLNRLLVHATPVGLCIVRAEALDIVVANPIARNVLGLAPGDTRLPDALRRAFDARGKPQEPGVSGEPAISQFSFAMARAPHDDIQLEITYAPATLDREDVFFCAMNDITERHRAEQILREAKLTAEATAKAKLAFFASMSHELRTPLASLVGNIELVAMGPLAPEQEARVRAMQSSAKGLLQIVNDVLDFSKIDVGELTLLEEWGSLADLLDRLAMSHAPLAVRNGLRFYVVIDRKLPARLLFDPIRVAQIVNNLLSNAFKFTNSGKIVLRASWADECVQITVADSGIGIPDELRQRLFQPFTQGSGSRLAQARGTGLGLSICARLTRLMKGTIQIDSTVGVGTRATVMLPLQPSAGDRQTAGWTLPWRRPALLCRAPEYREWLTGLFDPDASSVTAVADTDEPLDPAAHDFAIVTDEFAPHDVLSWWRDPRTIVWATQAGPLVPVRRPDGGVEVSVFSVAGLRAATQSVARAGEKDTAAGPAGVARADQPAQARSTAAPTVMIAEDNLLNRSLLRDQLTTLGAQVIEAARGDEALALVDAQPIDMVFTDINMPGMNGFELLEQLRARRPSIPVFAISASALPEDIAEGRARGFTDYLTKPVPLAVLAVALEMAGAALDAIPAGPPPHGERSGESHESGGGEIPDVPAIPPAFAQAFVEQSRADVSELADIVAERGLPRLRQWLHRVSGGLSVLGASKLLEQCRQLHAQAARADGWNDDIEQHSLAIGDVLDAMQSSMARHE